MMQEADRSLFTLILHPSSFQVAWLSLDEGDNDPTRFLAYLVAALQTISANIGARGVGCAPIPSASAHRDDSDNAAQ